MYLEHFGLKEMPFSLTPDPGFFFNYGGHREAMNVLRVALETGEGFVKITGEVGTGKTLLCRKLLNTLKEGFITTWMPNPLLSPLELYRSVAEEIGLAPPQGAGFQDLLKLLTERLITENRKGLQVVLVIDEVQAMPEDCLEALRLLSNLETEKRKLLQIVLFGQPELDERLSQASLRQLRQRISFSYRLVPLDPEGVQGYVAHRLLVAGHQGGAMFRARALKELVLSSGGNPRLINILCHKALLAAFGKGMRQVDGSLIRAAARDTEDAIFPRRQGLRRWIISGISALLAMEAVAIFLILRGGGQ